MSRCKPVLSITPGMSFRSNTRGVSSEPVAITTRRALSLIIESPWVMASSLPSYRPKAVASARTSMRSLASTSDASLRAESRADASPTPGSPALVRES